MKELIAYTDDDFATLVCSEIYKQYQLSVKDHGFFSFVLSGGKTPKSIFDKLASHYSQIIDWSKVYFFWTDERCVPKDHSDSNYRLANHSLFKYINAGAIFRVEGESEPDKAALQYTQVINDFFSSKLMSGWSFDCIMLGMGEDGHTASLFSLKDVKSKKDILVTQNEGHKNRRVTMGLRLLNQARQRILLVSSESKYSLFKSPSSNYPFSYLNNVLPIIRKECE